MWQGANELLYKELQFTISDFRDFVYGLIEVIQGLLD